MTSSETRTDSRKNARKKRSNRKGGDDKRQQLESARRDISEAPPASRAQIPRRVVWLGFALLLFGGWIAIMRVNRWYFGPPVFFLGAGWLAVLLTGRFLWNAGMAAAEEDDGTLEEQFWRAEGPKDELQREKRSLLKAIKEIEFDREMGKMSDRDAAELTQFYRSRAIQIIKALERTGDESELSISQKIDRELKARISVAAAGARGKAAAQSKERGAKNTVKAAKNVAAKGVDLASIASKKTDKKKAKGGGTNGARTESDARADAQADAKAGDRPGASDAHADDAVDAAVAEMATANEPELQKAEVGS